MTFDRRLKLLQARIVATKTDLVVLGPSSHMAWLTGLSPHGDERPVLLIVTKSYAGFLMPILNADSSKKITALPLYTWTDAEGPDAALVALLDDAGVEGKGLSVALDETMRADFALLVLSLLPEARHKFTADTVGALRAIKDDDEYRALKANAVLNDGAMKAGFAALRVGVTEREVADTIRAFYKAHGATTEFASVCFGENGAFPHHYTGERQLRANEAVLIDIGGRSQGYPSDMTRVAILGEMPKDFEKVFAVVNAAVEAALAAAKPGARAKEVDKAARGVIAAAGYGAHFLHRTGHGLGIDIHEAPYITETSETIIEEGQVFSIEPGIYLKGQFGLRLEEIVIMRNGKPEILSELPRATFMVPN